MKAPKNPQTHDTRRPIEGLELRRCLARRLMLKHTNINQMIEYMTGHMAKQHLEYYFDLALQETKEDEQL
ncbi:hypothetical protein HP062_24275 [Pseudomonas sp. B14-6]|uniref:hypothetical protein n=1 Tax=Pseudomonas sp. B14-6 TaxID=2738843 RepID=UPI00155E88CB|nr:hypothetical protein [Pseudomonas sp. B14-6]QKG68479.1 hypothetical protein HP062_24275 [Pseudomonas sp. B14-6]